MVAQATPGDTIRFECITLEDAHRLYREHAGRIQNITGRLAVP